MKSFHVEQKLHDLERGIESKRSLLAYLGSQPKRLTMESFICLADMLQKFGWILEDDRWRKRDMSLALLEAAIVELTAQISFEKDRILRNTVKGYRDSTVTS